MSHYSGLICFSRCITRCIAWSNTRTWGPSPISPPYSARCRGLPASSIDPTAVVFCPSPSSSRLSAGLCTQTCGKHRYRSRCCWTSRTLGWSPSSALRTSALSCPPTALWSQEGSKCGSSPPACAACWTDRRWCSSMNCFSTAAGCPYETRC